MAKVVFIVSIENYDEYEDKFLLNRYYIWYIIFIITVLDH